MMSAVLPSFSNLLAFDAAARHGNFTRAAQDLNVSQPAVSRRVALLEADLGVILFSRETRPLRLTPAGERLFDVLRSNLSQLETVVTEIRERQSENRITIATAPGFLAFWLVPRLAALTESFPECELSFITSEKEKELSRADIHVRFGAGPWPGMNAIRIMGEEVFPVCSPHYRAYRSPSPSVEDLKNEKLLQLSGSRQRWYDWASYFEAAGAPSRGKLNTLNFDSYAFLISAALAGQGVALCWAGLLDDHIATGALVRLSDVTVTSRRGYFATCAADTPPEGTTGRLMAWLANAT